MKIERENNDQQPEQISDNALPAEVIESAEATPDTERGSSDSLPDTDADTDTDTDESRVPANIEPVPVNLHLKLTQDLHLILTHLVRSSITHFVVFLPVVFSF